MLHDIGMSNMAPCPFCDQQGDYYIVCLCAGDPDYQYSVECTDCSATVYGNPSDNEQEAYDSAISSWNHRA